jgi:hypothetical protein
MRFEIVATSALAALAIALRLPRGMRPVCTPKLFPKFILGSNFQLFSNRMKDKIVLGIFRQGKNQ